MTKLHAVLIDPDKQTVIALETDDTLSDIYALLTRPFQPLVHDLNRVRVDRHHMCWLDGEGFLKPGTPLFQGPFYPTPLAGRGLVLGIDDAGENKHCFIPAGNFRAVIRWPDKVASGRLTPAVETERMIRIGDPILEDKPK